MKEYSGFKILEFRGLKFKMFKWEEEERVRNLEKYLAGVLKHILKGIFVDSKSFFLEISEIRKALLFSRN